MDDVIARIAGALDLAEEDGARPTRLQLGHQEAAELEAALYRRAKTWYGILGDVIAEDEEFAPKLPYPLTQPCRIFDVPVERVDEPSALVVIGEPA